MVHRLSPLVGPSFRIMPFHNLRKSASSADKLGDGASKSWPLIQAAQPAEKLAGLFGQALLVRLLVGMLFAKMKDEVGEGLGQEQEKGPVSLGEAAPQLADGLLFFVGVKADDHF